MITVGRKVPLAPTTRRLDLGTGRLATMAAPDDLEPWVAGLEAEGPGADHACRRREQRMRQPPACWRAGPTVTWRDPRGDPGLPPGHERQLQRDARRPHRPPAADRQPAGH